MKTHIGTRERGGDNVGNRTSMLATDPNGTRVHICTYDGTYQLTRVNYPDGYDYLALDTTFSYDAAGNRTTVVDANATSTYTSNSLNQYSAVDGRDSGVTSGFRN